MSLTILITGVLSVPPVADLECAVNTMIDEQGRIDVLVNNAGVGHYAAAEDMPLEHARQLFEVNLFGPGRLVQLVLPHMRAQRAGRIVNVSSMGGEIAFPLGAWYDASKHALEGYSDALRQEVKRFGIDVVLIQPGITKVAKAIRKAVESARPKPRYPVGYMARAAACPQPLPADPRLRSDCDESDRSSVEAAVPTDGQLYEHALSTIGSTGGATQTLQRNRAGRTTATVIAPPLLPVLRHLLHSSRRGTARTAARPRHASP